MSSLLREVLGDELRRARTNQGRTLRQVSDAARVSLGYLSEVERGRKEASSELLSAICDALDVSLSQLLVDASEQLTRRERAHESSQNPMAKPSVVSVTSMTSMTSMTSTAANIDASTKVVIPPVVALAIA